MREKLLGTPRVEKEWSWPKTILWAVIMAIALCFAIALASWVLHDHPEDDIDSYRLVR